MTRPGRKVGLLGGVAITLGAFAAAEVGFERLQSAWHPYQYEKPLLLYAAMRAFGRRGRLGSVEDWLLLLFSAGALVLLGISIGRLASSYRQRFWLFGCVTMLLAHQDWRAVYNDGTSLTGFYSLLWIGSHGVELDYERVALSAGLCAAAGMVFGKRPTNVVNIESEQSTAHMPVEHSHAAPHLLGYEPPRQRNESEVQRLFMLAGLLCFLSVSMLIVMGPREWPQSIFAYPWPSVSDGTWTLKNVSFDVALLSEMVLVVMAVLLFPRRGSRWLGLAILVGVMVWQTAIDTFDAWGFYSHVGYNMAVIGVSGLVTIWMATRVGPTAGETA